MKRVSQHIIEEESRKAFAHLIPDGWVMNDFAKDYGKDIHVEIFSKQVSTGYQFIVQLKGTDQKIHNSEIAIQMSVDVLKYYNSISTPVLLVFYSTAKKMFWGVWANHLIEVLKIKENQATVKVRLGLEQLLERKFFESLEYEFDRGIAAKINVDIEAHTQMQKAFSKRIVRWLEKYYTGSYGIKNGHFNFKFKVALKEDANYLHINLFLDGRNLKLDSISKKDLQRFVLNPVVTPETIEKEEAELLLFLTSSFARFVPKNSLLLLQRILLMYHGIYKNEITLVEIGNFAIENNCLFELQKLIDVVIDAGLIDDFNYLNMAFFRQTLGLDNYRRNLKRAIEKCEDERTRGLLCYNLANFLRNREDFNSSVHYFNKARKWRPTYLSKYYWWLELAGVLFMTGHERWAAFYYQKAIDLDTEGNNLPFTYALLADCLLWQGKYNEAAGYYDKFVKEVMKLGKVPTVNYCMLHDMCKEFVKLGLSRNGLDKELSDRLYKEGIENDDADKLEDAIAAYPLNYYAWTALGYMQNEKGKVTEALICVKNAALLRGNDRDTWLRCLHLCIKNGNETLSSLVFTVLIQQFGDDILHDINSMLAASEEMPFEVKQQGMESITEYAKHMYETVVKNMYMPPVLQIRVFEEKNVEP